jgi:hypothetical protein
VLFSISANAPTGNFTISAQGSSGGLSHSANLALTIQQGVATSLARTAFVRTDSVAALDNPAGESRHKHLAVDTVRRQLFAANRAMNRIEVFSSVDLARKALIDVAGASSADLSADGATLWAGAVTNEAVAIDAQTLHVLSRSVIPALTPLPNTTFDRPEELLAMSNGSLFVRLRQAAQQQSLLALWNPVTGSIANLTPTEPQLFQNGLGAMARTGDHAKLLVAASDSSGEVAVFDANGNVVSGPRGLGNGAIPLVVANTDGSRFAVALSANGSTQLWLLDASLSPVGGPVALQASSLTFARDGTALYVTQGTAPPAITVLDGHDLHPLGQVPDAAVQGTASQLEDAGDSGIIFGLGNRGLVLIDGTKPSNLSSAAPFFAAAPVAQPSEGPNAGGTSIILSGQNFSALTQLNVGTQAAENASLTGPAQIQASAPANAVSGAVNVTAYFSNGWLAVAPDAFSYGVQILQVLPNTGAKEGGDTIQIYGYGFGSDASKITAKIGGAPAVVQKVEAVAALGLAPDYPFSIERITLTVPAGNAGKADVAVTAASGTGVAARAFQYLQSAQFFAKPGFFKFIAYDSKRLRLYLSNIDHVDIFDLASQQFIAALQPPGGPPPTAGLRGLSLTPDGSQLVVADFGSQSVYLIDPDKATGTTIPVGGVSGFTNSGPARVAATSTSMVFIGMSGEGGTSTGCSACLAQLNLTASPPLLQPAPQPQVSTITGAPLLQGNPSGDHVVVAFGAASGSPIASWVASSPNQFSTLTANSAASDLAIAADGTSFTLLNNSTAEVRSNSLSLVAIPARPELTQISGHASVPGMAMHPSGALLYQPFLTGPAGVAGTRGGIDILDAHSGALRERILLAQQFLTDVDALHGSFLTIDETGSRLFALTSTDGTAQNAGVTIVQLASAPLGIGTVSPATGAAAGGVSLTVRGSGFQSGTTVQMGGKPAVVVVKDSSTLTVTTPALPSGPQQIVITNPDGETVSWDAAFTAN